MAQSSSIEWTDVTWNPSTGCSKVSTGCKYCYAENMSARLKAMGSSRYVNGFDFTMHWDKIEEPLSWKKPRKVFVNSMSDLFHEDSEFDFVRRVFDVMSQTPQHQFQVLTKRPDRMRNWIERLVDKHDYLAPKHIWLGTSVENQKVLHRIDELRQTHAGVRFLSCEPLLGPLDEIDLTGIHWVIAGGESGKHLWEDTARRRRGLVDYLDGEWTPRASRVAWIQGLRKACEEQDVPFFFKQWGGARPKAAGREIDGEVWENYPINLSEPA